MVTQWLKRRLDPLSLLPGAALLLPLLSCAAPRGISAILASFALLVVTSFAVTSGRDFYRQWRIAPAVKILWAVTAYLLVSTLWSPSPRALEMGRDITIVVIAGTILFGSLNAWTDIVKERVLRYFTIGLVLGTLYLMVQSAFDFPVARLLGDYPDTYLMRESNVPKRAAAALVLLLWPALCYLHLKYRPKVWPVVIVLAGVLIEVMCLYSRSAMLAGVGGAAALLLCLSCRRIQPVIGLIVLPLAIAVTILYMQALPAVQPLLESLLPFSGNERLRIWNYALQVGANFWPLGAGLDGSRAFSPQIESHPHNVYLQIFFDGGLVGVLLVSLMAGWLWAKIVQADAAVRPFLLGFAVCQAIVLSSAYGIWQGWWLAANMMAVFMLAVVLKLAGKPQ